MFCDYKVSLSAQISAVTDCITSVCYSVKSSLSAMTALTSFEDGPSLAHPVNRIPNPMNAATNIFQSSFDNIFDLQKSFN